MIESVTLILLTVSKRIKTRVQSKHTLHMHELCVHKKVKRIAIQENKSLMQTVKLKIVQPLVHHEYVLLLGDNL